MDVVPHRSLIVENRRVDHHTFRNGRHDQPVIAQLGGIVVLAALQRVHDPLADIHGLIQIRVRYIDRDLIQIVIRGTADDLPQIDEVRLQIVGDRLKEFLGKRRVLIGTHQSVDLSLGNISLRHHEKTRRRPVHRIGVELHIDRVLQVLALRYCGIAEMRAQVSHSIHAGLRCFVERRLFRGRCSFCLCRPCSRAAGAGHTAEARKQQSSDDRTDHQRFPVTENLDEHIAERQLTDVSFHDGDVLIFHFHISCATFTGSSYVPNMRFTPRANTINNTLDAGLKNEVSAIEEISS